MRERTKQALSLLKSCSLCPRNCGVNRLKDEPGYCKTGRKARVASFNAHFGEEAPLVGRRGSGTIFFSGCNLLCTFCQNYEISHYNQGIITESETLARMMTDLAEKGCHNINFVTPSHVIPQLLEAVETAAARGLNIPLVYNTGGYDKPGTLKLLEGIFDIYMPDFKFLDSAPAARYCQAPDYPVVVQEAVREMYRQVGDLVINEQGIAERGLLVRHLVMPGNAANTKAVVEFLIGTISGNTYINIMKQYWPCYKAKTDDAINSRITPEEYRQALDRARKAGARRIERQ